jgi:hypothetical protein
LKKITENSLKLVKMKNRENRQKFEKRLEEEEEKKRVFLELSLRELKSLLAVHRKRQQILNFVFFILFGVLFVYFSLQQNNTNLPYLKSDNIAKAGV